MDAEQVALAIDPEARQNSSGWICRCPAHEDRKASLSLSEGSGGKLLWRCYGGCSQEAVRTELKRRGLIGKPNGADRSTKRSAKPASWRPILPVPDDAKPAGFLHGKHGRPSATWRYRDAEGRTLFYVARFDLPGDGKEILPRCYGTLDGKRGWHWKAPPSPRPLYGLDRLAKRPKAPVLVVEGEKTVGVARKLVADRVVVTWQGGAEAVAKAAWSALKGRKVVVWPDADDAGQKAARAVAGALLGIASEVRIVALPSDLGGGWDLADPIPDDLDVEALIEGAPEAASEGEDTELSHDRLALDLAVTWQDGERYAAAWSCWLEWSDCRWRRDEVLGHMTACRVWLRRQAKELPPEAAKLAKWLRSAQTVASVLSLVRSDPRLAATTDQWDRDPFLLGGQMYADLHTGRLKPPDRGAYVIKSTACPAAKRGAEHPLWDRFLKRVTAGEAEVQDYLQRMAGYCLTGDVREHAMFFLYGTGGNGKSVFVDTLLGVMGDYALTIGSEMLMVSHNERHPTEVARLQGVHLAVAGEIEIGKTWAESKIKALTGGDRLQARYMRQNIFEFDPQFKLLVMGNHRPSLRGVDEAIRRRLHLVPFTVTIPPEERDLELKDKLKAEWPAILRWAIEGCLAWQAGGLRPPKVVTTATEEYLAAEDSFALWLEACAVEDSQARTASGRLWASWKEWAEAAGEYVGKQKGFSQTLIERGFKLKKLSYGQRCFIGLRLLLK